MTTMVSAEAKTQKAEVLEKASMAENETENGVSHRVLYKIIIMNIMLIWFCW